MNEYPGDSGKVLTVGDVVVHKKYGFGILKRFEGCRDNVIANVKFFGGFCFVYPVYLNKPTETDIAGVSEEYIRNKLDLL